MAKDNIEAKVFRATKNEATVTYEFGDASTEKVKVRSLTSKEQEENSIGIYASTAEAIEKSKSIVEKMLVNNDKELIEKIIQDQYEHADIVDFKNALDQVIREIKIKKLRDS